MTADVAGARAPRASGSAPTAGDHHKVVAALSRWAAAIVAVAIVAGVLLTHGVAVADVGTYALYLSFVVLAPGVLVARALLGRSASLLADVSLGGVVGMLLTLPTWWVTVSLGWGEHLTWWPLIVYLGFAIVPGLRRHWRPERYRERLGPVLSWVLTVSVGLAMVPFVGAFRATAPLTGPNEWPFDLHWHLGLVELFVRQVGPQDSQVSGESLAYHWFAHADIAAASLGSGVDPAVLVSRLWALPLVVLTLCLLVAVLSELTRHGRRAGAIAALFVAAPAGLEVLPWIDVPWDPVFAPLSPTQTYSYPMLLLTVLLIGRVLRGGSRRELCLLIALFVLGPGTKVSTMPIIISGLLLATAMAMLLRSRWRRLALLTLTSILATVAGTVMMGAGGAAGSGLQVLSTLDRLPAYYRTVGMLPREASLSSGLWPGGLEVPGAWAILVLLLLATVVKYAWVAPGLSLLRGRGGSFEPVPWVLAGGGLAGWLLMLLVDQYGVSQAYFLLTGTILWAMFGAWGLMVLVERSVAATGRRATTRGVRTGALVGIVIVLTSALAAESAARRLLPKAGALPPLDVPHPAAMATAMTAGLVPVTLTLAVGVVYLVVRRRQRSVTGALATVAVGVVAASLVLNPWFSRPHPTPPLTSRALMPAEVEPARWIAEQAGPHDVVATNVHCRNPGARSGCDARAFWVSSLTRRRTFVGGWAYLDRTRALAAGSEVPQALQPFYDQQRLALNDALFERPTPQVVARLVDAGVRWVYADRRHGAVSSDLGSLATLVLSTQDVDIYRLVGTPVAR